MNQGCCLDVDVSRCMKSSSVGGKSRRDGGSPLITADRRTTFQPHNELGKHHSSQHLKSGRVSFFVWRLQSDSGAAGPVRWTRHQRPPLAIAWIPANSLCDFQTAIGGDGSNGPLLCCVAVTAHSAPDHQTDGLCVARNISDSSEPSSCSRLPCLLGWHPRQKSHHSHDMVAPPARCPTPPRDINLPHTVGQQPH